MTVMEMQLAPIIMVLIHVHVIAVSLEMVTLAPVSVLILSFWPPSDLWSQWIILVVTNLSPKIFIPDYRGFSTKKEVFCTYLQNDIVGVHFKLV